MSPPDVRVVIERTGHNLTRCVVVDDTSMAEINLPLCGVEYEHKTGATGKVKLTLFSDRVFFEDT